LDCGVPRACKTFKRTELAKNNNFNVCRFLINTNTAHFAFSKYAFSSILGVFLAFLFVTPLAYRFTELKFTKIIFKRKDDLYVK